jgi:hypothetical protein
MSVRLSPSRASPSPATSQGGGRPSFAGTPLAPQSTTIPPNAVSPTPPQPLELTLVSKAFKARDIHAGDYEDAITLDLSGLGLAQRADAN